MDIMKILAELEGEMVGKKGTFAKKVNVEKCAALVFKLKSLIPESISEAEFVVARKNEILANADKTARNTLLEADARAEHIIENSEIVRRAEIERKKIIDTAYMQCDELVVKTKSHLDGMFKEIEQFLLSTLAMIRNNREELNSALIINPNSLQNL